MRIILFNNFYLKGEEEQNLSYLTQYLFENGYIAIYLDLPEDFYVKVLN